MDCKGIIYRAILRIRNGILGIVKIRIMKIGIVKISKNMIPRIIIPIFTILKNKILNFEVSHLF